MGSGEELLAKLMRDYEWLLENKAREIRWALKRLRVAIVRETTLKTVAAVLALRKRGFTTFTAYEVSALTGIDPTQSLVTLHRLADFNVVRVLRRPEYAEDKDHVGKPYRFVLTPEFERAVGVESKVHRHRVVLDSRAALPGLVFDLKCECGEEVEVEVK